MRNFNATELGTNDLFVCKYFLEIKISYAKHEHLGRWFKREVRGYLNNTKHSLKTNQQYR
jgi:uncharacterized protein YacL (UPF0231 family)